MEALTSLFLMVLIHSLTYTTQRKKERKQDHILDDAATAEYEIKRTGGLDERNYHASETYENPERQN